MEDIFTVDDYLTKKIRYSQRRAEAEQQIRLVFLDNATLVNEIWRNSIKVMCSLTIGVKHFHSTVSFSNRFSNVIRQFTLFYTGYLTNYVFLRKARKKMFHKTNFVREGGILER